MGAQDYQCDIKVSSIHAPHFPEKWPTAAQLDRFDKIIITVRDPVARFVSAFNWHHPRANIGSERTPFEIGIYECFSHVSELADSLARSHPSEGTRSPCEKLAWGA